MSQNARRDCVARVAPNAGLVSLDPVAGLLLEVDLSAPVPAEVGATRRRYPPSYKQAILAEYDTLSREGKGTLLQREGLYLSLLAQWRTQRDRGSFAALSARSGRPALGPIRQRNARLRERVDCLEADLANAETEIYIQKTLRDVEYSRGAGQD